MDNTAIIGLGQKYVMNTYGRIPIALVQGQGSMVTDADGKHYLDLVGGIAVNSLGHCHPKVVEAIREQAATLIHVSNVYWNRPMVEVAKTLVENSFADRVFFCNSGAEANEGAIKLARKYGKQKWGRHKVELITMSNSFHGRTLTAVTATAQPKYQEGYEPLPGGFKYVEYGNLEALKAAITPETLGILVEPIQGEGGVNEADAAYWQAVKALCEEKELLLVFDEVQCGLGRCGKLFAHELYGVTPDIMTLAKALGGGFPIGAILATEEVAGAFQPGDHGSTFGGNPLAAAAAKAVLEVLIQDGLVEHAREQGEYFKGKLKELADNFPFVKEVRGQGLLLGMELDRPGKDLVAACIDQGLLINCTSGNVLRFMPALTITRKEIDQAVTILREVFKTID